MFWPMSGDALERILQLVQRLKPLDREVMLLYLDGVDTTAIGEITGISAGNVRILIHRIKNILARRFQRLHPALVSGIQRFRVDDQPKDQLQTSFILLIV